MGNNIKPKKAAKRLKNRIAGYESTVKNKPPHDIHKPGSYNK